MYIPEKMKVNKFVDVAIPSNKSFFTRLGEVKPLPNAFSGDDQVVLQQSKIDQIEAYAQYAAEEAAKESNKSE